jgi:hypothetical protein
MSFVAFVVGKKNGPVFVFAGAKHGLSVDVGVGLGVGVGVGVGVGDVQDPETIVGAGA